jgi:predicted nucleotidyltransferase
MAKKSSKLCRSVASRWYRGNDISMRVIRRFARDVAREFHPDKIILFGSYAYGTPHDDSDVDILVIIPARSPLVMAARIDNAINPPFPLDIIVRTPSEMRWRLEERESFLTEIVARGKVLYEKDNAGVGPKGRERLSTRQKARTRQRTLS